MVNSFIFSMVCVEGETCFYYLDASKQNGYPEGTDQGTLAPIFSKTKKN